MIERLFIVETQDTNPYRNLALEETLLLQVPEGDCILYLWQNYRTVVIGRNQNCWKECRVENLEKSGGLVARRLSGGGAVFHDLGNLNFTFLVREKNYNLDKQMEVILRAVQNFGLNAEKSGRNDITVDGRKFSGNAFYNTGGRSYHHGTLLINANMEHVAKYLNVSADKLKSKGVDSVKARVINLGDLSPAVTVAAMRQSLAEAFASVYSLKPAKLEKEKIDPAGQARRAAFFASEPWVYGRIVDFTYEAATRFPWGSLQLQLQTAEGRIQDGQLYSDAMDSQWCQTIIPALKDCTFSSDQIAARISGLPYINETQKMMAQDLATFIKNQEV